MEDKEKGWKTNKVIFYALFSSILFLSTTLKMYSLPPQKKVVPQTPITLTPTPTEEITIDEDNIATDAGIIILTPTATPSSNSAIKKTTPSQPTKGPNNPRPNIQFQRQ